VGHLGKPTDRGLETSRNAENVMTTHTLNRRLPDRNHRDTSSSKGKKTRTRSAGRGRDKSPHKTRAERTSRPHPHPHGGHGYRRAHNDTRQNDKGGSRDVMSARQTGASRAVERVHSPVVQSPGTMSLEAAKTLFKKADDIMLPPVWATVSNPVSSPVTVVPQNSPPSKPAEGPAGPQHVKGRGSFRYGQNVPGSSDETTMYADDYERLVWSK